jgi:membrane AbrB-like protein
MWLWTLALGTAGGWLFMVAGLPLPWMLGAVTVTTLAAVAGLRVAVEDRFRWGMVSILGVMLGAAFQPGIWADMATWWPSMLGLLVFVALSMLAVAAYFRRVARYDPPTAYFSAAPGGINYMAELGREMGGDDRAIALNHALRIFLVVLCIPTAFTLLLGYERPAGVGAGPGAAGLGIPPSDLAWLIGCAVAGSLLARLLRVPAGPLLGPMVVSALVHGLGWTASHPPALLVAAAQVVVGCGIGTRFSGVPARAVGRALVVALGATAVLLVVTVGCAGALSLLTDLPTPELILAYAPGGVVEMSLVSLAMDLDVAFVSTHHIVRIMLVIALAPVVVRLIRPP